MGKRNKSSGSTGSSAGEMSQSQQTPPPKTLRMAATSPDDDSKKLSDTNIRHLERAYRADGVRATLKQELVLTRTPSELSKALLIPALRRLKEKARMTGHADLPTRTPPPSGTPLSMRETPCYER
ncbi:Hypp9543 [Branchiostoma lanceolatum]|uniref:Hypp9543 protein n=1 Tax=Branchiostoma lanceolatum TaxID=7740 RepID=A0A8S4MNE8_BRALA|nr:Hypp9543 [Branchiostoma lanceolatum]